MRLWPRTEDVTIPEEGDHFLAPIPVSEIQAYGGVADVPAPANLAQGQPLPIRAVEVVRVKTASGWETL